MIRRLVALSMLMAVGPVRAERPVRVFDLSRPSTCAASADPTEVEVCGRPTGHPDNLLPIVVNGAAGTMLVDPGGPTRPACNADFALRAHFHGVGPVPISRVGSVEVSGGLGTVLFRSDDTSFVRETVWSVLTAVVGADCWMGPGALTDKIVTFRLAPPRPGARTAILPISPADRLDRDDSTDAQIVGRGLPIMVRFEAIAARRPTLLTATATLALANDLGARLAGPVTQEEIWFGIRRPVRRLLVRQPLVIGPLVIPTLFARVSDYGDASRVQTIDPNEIDPDDVVVAKRPRKPGGSRIVRVGRDDLLRCQSITFDKHAHTIELTC